MVAALLLISAGAAAQDATTRPGETQQDVPKTARRRRSRTFRWSTRSTSAFAARSSAPAPTRPASSATATSGTAARIDRLRIFKDTDAYRYSLQADNVGYRDQRFSASYMNYGKVKASFEWNQIPLFYSRTTSTLYDTSTPGTLTLDDGVQSGIQNKTLTLANALTGAVGLRPADAARHRELRADLQRDAQRRLQRHLQEHAEDRRLSLGRQLRDQRRDRHRNAGARGSPDHRCRHQRRVRQRTRLSRALGYDGSFFHNNVTTLTWDNPSRITDSPTLGPVQGRMALWPNTEMNTVSAAGGLNLPGRSHATAFLSVASLTNDNPLLPYTINTALVSPALDRPNSDVKAAGDGDELRLHLAAGDDALVQRAVPPVPSSTTARCRSRPATASTTTRRSWRSTQTSEPFGSTRHTFDADAIVHAGPVCRLPRRLHP